MSAWSVWYSLNRLGYLKHAWDDVLTFKRASRSLAKTGFGCLYLLPLFIIMGILPILVLILANK